MRSVSTPEQVAAQAEALRKIRALAIERDKAAETAAEMVDLVREAILEALAIGTQAKDIAKASGLSHQRISQIKGGQ